MTYRIKLRYRETNELEDLRVVNYELGLPGVFLYFNDSELAFVPYTNVYNLDIEKED